jgi:gluconokinase
MIAERLAARHHEFMTSTLLDSQLATLETPSDAEALRVVNDRPPEEIVSEILAHVTSNSA